MKWCLKMNRKIGIYDSGLGGIIVLDTILKKYQNYDFVYVGDQKYAPYGDKSKEELIERGSKILSYFDSLGITTVVVACNTMCAVAIDDLKKRFSNMKFYGVIEPTALSLKDKNVKNILVMATKATTNQHAYAREIEKVLPDANVMEVACPKLVPLLEKNGSEDNIMLALHEYLDEYLGKTDAIVLGCTHFPLVKNEIASFMNVALFDSNEAVCESLPFVEDDVKGSVTIYTTLDKKVMKQQIQSIIQKDYDVDEISFA